MRAQGGGRIVNCSSVLGFVAVKWRGAYVATKFALEGLTDVLRLEMRGTGIHVILIEPGPVTSRIRRERDPAFRALDRLAGLGPRGAITRALRSRLYEGGSRTGASCRPRR